MKIKSVPFKTVGYYFRSMWTYLGASSAWSTGVFSLWWHQFLLFAMVVGWFIWTQHRDTYSERKIHPIFKDPNTLVSAVGFMLV